MNKNLTDVLNDFRKMKINYDIERFNLISYQLEDLINNYNTLLELRKDIQLKYYKTIENMKQNDIDIDIDYKKWNEIKSNEEKELNDELNELINLKYEIDEALNLLNNGEIEKILIEEEKQIISPNHSIPPQQD